MKLNLVAKLVDHFVSTQHVWNYCPLQIRGMPIADALAQIQFCDKKAADFVEQVTHTIRIEGHFGGVKFATNKRVDWTPR